MAQTPTDELAKNILYALRVANVSHKELAAELQISPATVGRRLNDGNFTYGQIVEIARLVNAPVTSLLPRVSA